MRVTHHTPGPWRLAPAQRTKLFGYDQFVQCVSGASRMDGLVAVVPSQVNARLIAAAPKMLEELEAAVVAICQEQQWLATQHPHVWARLMAATDSISDVIADATGEGS